VRDYEEQSGGVLVIAPFDIVLSDHNVLQPDVVFFRSERRHLLHDWEPARVRPDLAVEVLSPGTQLRDRGRKREILASFGLPEYWIIDPAKNALDIYVLRDGAFVLALTADALQDVESPTLAGLSFPSARLFAA
jgi:Uma2 family endonuclease